MVILYINGNEILCRMEICILDMLPASPEQPPKRLGLIGLNKKLKRASFFNIILLLTIKLLSTRSEPDNKLNQNLKDCRKKYFFTIETINVSNCISEQFLETNLCFLYLSKIRCRKYSGFFQLLLLLSGDINPNPGPRDSDSNKMWEPFVKKGLHFIHVNINSLLPKIDELRSIAQKSNAAVIGITESKLDESVLNSELHIDNYTLIRCDRNRHSSGVACYARDDISYNQNIIFNNGVESIFIDIHLPKPNLLQLVYSIDHLTSQNFLKQ